MNFKPKDTPITKNRNAQDEEEIRKGDYKHEANEINKEFTTSRNRITNLIRFPLNRPSRYSLLKQEQSLLQNYQNYRELTNQYSELIEDANILLHKKEKTILKNYDQQYQDTYFSPIFRGISIAQAAEGTYTHALERVYLFQVQNQIVQKQLFNYQNQIDHINEIISKIRLIYRKANNNCQIIMSDIERQKLSPSSKRPDPRITKMKSVAKILLNSNQQFCEKAGLFIKSLTENDPKSTHVQKSFKDLLDILEKSIH